MENNSSPEWRRVQFDDWRWQIKNSVKTPEDLLTHLPNNQGLSSWLSQNFASSHLPFAVTPYFVSLMSGDAACPIFAQVITSNQELELDSHSMRDPLGEEGLTKVPHLVHRYPDRVLFLATDRCASYCRFCTRKRWVGQGPTPMRENHEEAFRYIETKPHIREIIFSGGDPLLLSNERLAELFSRAFSIPHIEIVRIHSRMLSFAPMRVDEGLLSVLKKFSPIFLVAHFNHPREITAATKKAIASLQEASVLVLNQSVLLKNINDNEAILEELFRTLIKLKVRPYYLHQCDVINGARHFRVPITRALEIMSALRGHISGLCLPTLVIDIPGGHGKVPLVENPIVKEDENFVYLKGFNGGIAAYPKTT